MASKNKSILTLSGFDEIATALLKLPKELAEIVEKDVLREASKPIQKAAKRHAKGVKDTGLLVSSIGVNVRRVRRKMQYANRYTSRVGAKGIRKEVTRRQRLKDKDGQYTGKIRFYKEMANPANYAHLVEYGTSKIPARPFIRPALEETQDQILDLMAKGYEKGMGKVVKKIRSRK